MTAQAGVFTSASLAGLPIYPYYCRTLSLTLGRWCPLRATDVFALKEVDAFAGQNVYFYKNHMIKYVRLTGVIVAIDEPSGWIILTLDDSSGATIEAICAAPAKPVVDILPGVKKTIGDGVVAIRDTKATAIKSGAVTNAPNDISTGLHGSISPDGPNLTNINVGSVVKIKGCVGTFREQRQIRLKSILVLGDTNAEVKCWNDMVKFKREVLSSPWVVTAEDEEKCRLEQDREARWQKEEDIKKKRDQLKRHLKEKAKELRDAHRNDHVSDVEQAEKKSKHRERSIDVKRTGWSEDREKKRKHSERGDELEMSKGLDDEGKRAKQGEINGEGLQPNNRVNYPSRAARRRAAGKYDALGI